MSLACAEQKRPLASGSVIDDLCINTIRTLSMDEVQKAKSGHPRTPIVLAPVICTRWRAFLRFDADDPLWPNRDRFVLSYGDALMSRFGFTVEAVLASAREQLSRAGRRAP